MVEGLNEWLQGLRCFTHTPSTARAFQDFRFRFAHALGHELTSARDDSPALHGSVLYGIYMDTIGCLYVGQTTKGQRRLRDLPIGESHHLANTFPPEVWDRVVVVAWREALLADRQARKALGELGGQHDDRSIGLGFEYLLQCHTAPLFNGRRKTSRGDWAEVDLTRSKSTGALTAPALQPIWPSIRSLWDDLASVQPAGDSHVAASGRAVFPAEIRTRLFGM